MRKYKFLFAGLLLALSSLSVLAQRPAAQATPTPQRPPATTAPQTPPSANVNLPVSKLAVIYTEEFLDAKTGILKFGTVIAKLNAEFQKEKDSLNQMSQRAGQLEDEINKLRNAPSGTPIDQKSLQTKIDQFEQLKRDIQRRGEDAQGAYNKRRSELFDPLQKEIGAALEAFAKARNINVIIDGTDVPLSYAADSINITKAFIADFNSKNPVTASTTPPQ
jgi:Skp family chaperone for outer membrane proteins